MFAYVYIYMYVYIYICIYNTDINIYLVIYIYVYMYLSICLGRRCIAHVYMTKVARRCFEGVCVLCKSSKG